MQIDRKEDASLKVTARGAVYREARVFYEKVGRAKYISHLDVTRCMQRAIKRAGLSLWYTEGFNPHIYMTFALPLSLGYESRCEVMDIRLTEDIAFEEVCRRLDEALPEDIHILRVAPPKRNPAEITSARYEVRLLADSLLPKDGRSEEWKAAFLSFMNSETIEVEKRTKKGNKLVDIKLDCRLLSVETIPDGICLRLEMAAGNTKNINPTLLTDEFLKRQGLERVTALVERLAVYTADGEEFA